MNVYFSGCFCGKEKGERKGKLLPGSWRFEWADRNWSIPGIYRFGQGFVIDLIREMDEAAVQDFFNRYPDFGRAENLSQEKRLALQAENPFDSFCGFSAEVNGRTCRDWQGQSTYWVPFLNQIRQQKEEELASIAGEKPLPQPPSPEQQLLEEYGFDWNKCWQINRYRFRWPTKNPPRKLKTLRLIFRNLDRYYPIGKHFELSVGEEEKQVEFIHPLTGRRHKLILVGSQPLTLPENSFGQRDGEYDFPRETVQMEFTVLPPLPEGHSLTILDTKEGDKPIKRQSRNYGLLLPQASCSVGIIGGASGPVALDSDLQIKTVFGSMWFKPQKKVQWSIAGVSAPKWPGRTLQILL